jgi:hypothetical protein
VTRPNDMNGLHGGPAQQWTRPASYPSQPFSSPVPGPQPPYPSYPPQGYAYAWAGPSQPFPPGPPPAGVVPGVPQARTKPSIGKLLALGLAGLLVVGLLGGALLRLAGSSTAPAGQAAPAGTAGAAPSVAAAPVVSMSLPPTIDGHPQIDNQYSRQLLDTERQQLQALSPDAVIGMYGDPGQPPAFVVIAGTTTTSQDPDLMLTGIAAGFQNSLNSQNIVFVDQPAGPLGGKMRCAQHSPMVTCIWSVGGAFGMNMMFEQDLTKGAATTLRVRDAIETHST